MRRCSLVLGVLFAAVVAHAGETVVGGWQMQDAARVDAGGESISLPGYSAAHWYKAVVPGTALTTLVANKVYPEPLYGENNRLIPETLAHTSFWYRTNLPLPKKLSGRHLLLRFEGINYLAEVYVNGHDLGPIKGAFVRGEFDIKQLVAPGQTAGVAVHVYPPPHPGHVYEQTIKNGVGPNGGLMGQDGPTFVASIGWDWMPGIRDRDTGIWQNVKLIDTGEVVIRDPYVKTELPLPKTDSAKISVSTTLQNLSGEIQEGVCLANVEGTKIGYSQHVKLQPGESRLIDLGQQVMDHPKLWWPNGYGKPDLYRLRVQFMTVADTISSQANSASDLLETQFGVKQYGYFVPGSKNLTVQVNGVPVFCKGGNWGMDEAMKRSPVERLDAQMRLHRDANYTMIRNWVGQATQEDFYNACDKYGIMVWDDFWLANPADGPIPNDNALFLKNAKEKIIRFRNHPSIGVWCGRNEAEPPPILNKGLADLIAQYDPSRFYQPHSAAINGVGGGGPYAMRQPGLYFNFRANDALHTEVGLPSIPTLEAIENMMPAKDWSPDWKLLNDDWAEHDLASGAQDGQRYPRALGTRFGPVSNLADFVRKSQLANYECYRAIYEGRNSKLFDPATGVMIWMSNPAQPSFVWQIYSYDLEPNATLFGVRKGCEPIHIQLNPNDWHVDVINNTPNDLRSLTATARLYDLEGRQVGQSVATLTAKASKATYAVVIPQADRSRSLQFVELTLNDTKRHVLSQNFYWMGSAENPNNLTDLQKLPPVPVSVSTRTLPAETGFTKYLVTITNPTENVALTAHLQLRKKRSGVRVLPVFYSDNYVSLLPHRSQTITLEFSTKELAGEKPLLKVDGFNVVVANVAPGSIAVETNLAMKPGPILSSPPAVPNAPGVLLSLRCGDDPLPGSPYVSDEDYVRGGFPNKQPGDIDTSLAGEKAAPKELYSAERWSDSTYFLPVPPLQPGHHYTLRLHFAELSQFGVGKRRFSVLVNGNRVLSEFDIFAEAGGAGRVLIKDFPVDTLDPRGGISVAFRQGSANEPEIRAIQVLKD